MQAVEILGERLVVVVSLVGFDGGEDGVLANEAYDVVDVAVRVVAGAAAIEPEDLLDAEIIGEGLFELRARCAGIALLDFLRRAGIPRW